MVRCPRCDAPPIEVRRVEHLNLGRCQKCHLVFDLDQRPFLPTPVSSEPRNRRLRAPAALEAWERTVRTKVAYRDEEGMRELTMELPWRGTMSVADAGWFRIYVFLLMLTLPLSAVAGGWLTGRAIGCLIGVLIALGPAFWGVAANSVNRTRIEVRGGRLSVRHGPMRWLAPLEVEARHVDQMFVEERASEHKGRKFYSYDLKLLRKASRSPIDLLRGITDPEVALFLERRAEEALGVEDRDVGGYSPPNVR